MKTVGRIQGVETSSIASGTGSLGYYLASVESSGIRADVEKKLPSNNNSDNNSNSDCTLSETSRYSDPTEPTSKGRAASVCLQARRIESSANRTGS